MLAYIPLGETVPISDIAELAGLPAPQLARVVRMTATAGFLLEPQPDHVAHTSLSAAFVQPGLHYLDATLFLGKVSAPEGLRMAKMTRQGDYLEDSHAGSCQSNRTLEMLDKTLPTRLSLQNPKLQRSWPTFLQCLGDVDDSIDEVLIRLDWNSLGKATIVDVSLRLGFFSSFPGMGRTLADAPNHTDLCPVGIRNQSARPALPNIALHRPVRQYAKHEQ